MIEDICKFAGLPKAGPSSSNVSSVAASASISSSPATKKKKGKKADAGEKAIGIDLKDFSIYHPGEKIVIPLTTPNEHLTGPCWRGTDVHVYFDNYEVPYHLLYQTSLTLSQTFILADFGRAVRRNARWEAKRVAATPSEKAQYKETRKGKVYFINVIYTVPGKPLPKQAKKAPEKPAGKRKIDDTVNYTFPVKPSSTQVKKATELTAGKKAIDNINNYTAPAKPSPKMTKKAPELLAGKKAINNYTAPAESSLKQAEKAPYKPTGKKAIDHVLKTYYAAVNSGVNSITGEVDGKILKEAMDAGHSRQTILARVAELRGDGDQKPSAKRLKQG